MARTMGALGVLVVMLVGARHDGTGEHCLEMECALHSAALCECRQPEQTDLNRRHSARACEPTPSMTVFPPGWMQKWSKAVLKSGV